MKNNKLYFFTIITICCIQSYAQQDVTFTLYNYNMNIINPAYAGTGENFELTSNYRAQWAGLDEAPETWSFSLSGPMRRKEGVGDKVGLGLSVTNSSVFVLKETDVFVDFSYKLQLKETLDLYLGVKAGGSSVNIDLAGIGLDEDPLFSENVSVFNPNVGMGAYLKGERFYVNLSAPALLKTRRYEKESGIVTQATDKMQFFMGAGYHFTLNKNLTFTPFFLTRVISEVPFSMDISGTFDLYDKAEFGLSYRLKESISTVVLFKMLDRIKVGYAYDSSITAVSNYRRGNHEVILKVPLFSEKQPQPQTTTEELN
ncbi:PorP/SprF family type IX secretion system membrane protein [Aquimarina spongiae]|uniref:Type IX secretion system membrane protein, PorP/SprF family n=1 Tax=Aquimarina spongiae TaxID=570521 RepID=A0A1M6CXF9_9FLAO|nr:type IX secretion system membrane protein PorP/SprF [Aquimarina spongiae]SHI65676.1 type IX secretion system membrane protein, PorP/SprF family [Aquimarina spongiae]